jgi:hypothetical protein
MANDQFEKLFQQATDFDKSLPYQKRIPAANLDAAGMVTPKITPSLDRMKPGLSLGYGASWRERRQLLLERLGPFRLGYLESLRRAADCRASAEEDRQAREGQR